MQYALDIDGSEASLWLARDGEGYRLHVEGGASCRVRLVARDEDVYDLYLDDTVIPVLAATDGDRVHIALGDIIRTVCYLDNAARFAHGAHQSEEDHIRAPMPGTVIAVNVAPGAAVGAGDTLVVIESMKLETPIRAKRAGTVDGVHVKPGQSFERDAVLLSLHPNEAR